MSQVFFLQILNFPIQVIEETHLITELIQYSDCLGEKKTHYFAI